ncbi:MAG TPA: zinc-binding dehydrogenase [Candidatus Baltobacteraceae bacterium]|nr:zinc-binding dehydrogenase [Candidatus Baltobacteraceae bacterium]
MKALMHGRFGEPLDVVSLGESPSPQPRAGEVRVRVLRSPIHNHDLATIRGIYGYKPALPAIGGSELLGVVDALGEGVTNLKPGMRVAGIARGAWAEEALLAAASSVPIPDAIDDDRGAQLVAMPMSAVVLFDVLGVEPGAWIAQNAANGAVGRILSHVAQARGVNIVNFVRRDDAAADLRAHGAKHVLVTEREGWEAEALALTGGAGFARIVDSVTGPFSLVMQRLLARGGELIVFGGLAAGAMKLDPGLMISSELTVRGFWMTSWMTRASAADRAKAMGTVFELAMKGELPLPVGGVFTLAHASDALRAAETPGRTGKILLRP